MWNGLLFLNGTSFTIVTAVVVIWPNVVRLSSVAAESAGQGLMHDVNTAVGSIDAIAMPMAKKSIWTISQYELLPVLVSGALCVAVGLSRLAILGSRSSTASTFAILSSVGLIPVRLYFTGTSFFDGH